MSQTSGSTVGTSFANSQPDDCADLIARIAHQFQLKQFTPEELAEHCPHQELKKLAEWMEKS